MFSKSSNPFQSIVQFWRFFDVFRGGGGYRNKTLAGNGFRISKQKQRQQSRGVLEIYRRTNMPKCHFNTSAGVFSCKFAAYFSEQNTSGWLLMQQDFQCQSHEKAGRKFWEKTS